MKKWFIPIAALPLFCSVHGESADVDVEVAAVHGAFPYVSKWDQLILSVDTVLLRGELVNSYGERCHIYCAVRTRGGVARLVMTHSEVVEFDQLHSFWLQGDEIYVFYADGDTVLAKWRLWESPPAAFSVAPKHAQLSYVGYEAGCVVCEVENLLPYGFLILRPGQMRMVAYQASVVLCAAEPLIQREYIMLAPGQRCRLKLEVPTAMRSELSALTGRYNIELVYEKYADACHEQEITPARILQTGLPALGAGAHECPIHLREDLAVVRCASVSGFSQYALNFYQLRDGVWYHAQHTNLKGAEPARRFECNGDTVRVMGADGKILAEVQIPRAQF